jgi:hypothetical protein
MAVTPRCPSCRFDIAPSEPGHASSAGPVRYLRCVCGLWLVLLNEEPIAAAGTCDLSLPAGLPGAADR